MITFTLKDGTGQQFFQDERGLRLPHRNNDPFKLEIYNLTRTNETKDTNRPRAQTHPVITPYSSRPIPADWVQLPKI